MKPQTLLAAVAVLLGTMMIAFRPGPAPNAGKRTLLNDETAKVATASGLKDVTLSIDGKSGYKGTGVDAQGRPVGLVVTREGKQLRWRTTIATSDGRVLETGGGVVQ